jgi:hypothetical protein
MYIMYNKYILPSFFQGQTLRQVPGVCRGEYILLDLLVEKSLSQAGQQSFLPKGGGQVCAGVGRGGLGLCKPCKLCLRNMAVRIIWFQFHASSDTVESDARQMKRGKKIF